MRRSLLLFLFSFSCLAFCLISPLSAATENGTAWFEDIQVKSSFTEAQLQQMAGELFLQLKAGKKAKEIVANFPEENLPRAVFLTIGEDNWPGRVYFGVGFSFRHALENAILLLQDNEPVLAKKLQKTAQARMAEMKKAGQVISPAWKSRAENPDAWNWLRFYVVDEAKQVKNFAVPRSRLAFSSSVGIAFPAIHGFAFTPAQLTGRALLDATGHLAQQQISNVISESYNWLAMGEWMRFSAVQNPYPVSLFCGRSFWASSLDEKVVAVPLVRGHQLRLQELQAEELQRMAFQNAAQVGNLIVAGFSSKEKKLKAPFAEWGGREFIWDYLEYSLLLARLARQSADPEVKKTLLDQAGTILDLMMLNYAEEKPKKGESLAKTERRGWIVEDEHLAADSRQIPRKIVSLRTNALAVLLAMELLDQGRANSELLGKVEYIVRYLRSQCSWKNLFHNGMLLETKETLMNVEDWPVQAPVETVALTALALHEHGCRSNHVDSARELRCAKEAMDAVLTETLAPQSLEMLPLSPWLVEALGTCLEGGEKQILQQMLRLGLAAEAKMEVNPLLPDQYGATSEICGETALDAATLSALSLWLGGHGKAGWSREELRKAEFLMLNHLQGFIDLPESSLLPSPIQYRGFFRQNLDSYLFAFGDQLAQLHSLQRYLAALRQQKKFLYQATLRAKLQERQKTITEVASHSVLSPSLVQTDATSTSIDQRSVTGEASVGAPVRSNTNPFATKGKK